MNKKQSKKVARMKVPNEGQMKSLYLNKLVDGVHSNESIVTQLLNSLSRFVQAAVFGEFFPLLIPADLKEKFKDGAVVEHVLIRADSQGSIHWDRAAFQGESQEQLKRWLMERKVKEASQFNPEASLVTFWGAVTMTAEVGDEPQMCPGVLFVIETETSIYRMLVAIHKRPDGGMSRNNFHWFFPDQDNPFNDLIPSFIPLSDRFPGTSGRVGTA